MRAKTVNENLEFKRGIEPKESLGLGALGIALALSSAEFAALMMYYNYEGVDDWRIMDEDLTDSVDPDKIEEIGPILKSHFEFGPSYGEAYEDMGGLAKHLEHMRHDDSRNVYDAGIEDDVWSLVYTDLKIPAAYDMIENPDGHLFENIENF